mmetsp:Transcript_93244/g.240995  ORF Transcript_93244/g.240995 Transcript_93244/m.240995 type:complete len:257 (+) Transcript_93244:233-1003(+)
MCPFTFRGNPKCSAVKPSGGDKHFGHVCRTLRTRIVHLVMEELLPPPSVSRRCQRTHRHVVIGRAALKVTYCPQCARTKEDLARRQASGRCGEVQRPLAVFVLRVNPGPRIQKHLAHAAVAAQGGTHQRGKAILRACEILCAPALADHVDAEGLPGLHPGTCAECLLDHLEVTIRCCPQQPVIEQGLRVVEGAKVMSGLKEALERCLWQACEMALGSACLDADVVAAIVGAESAAATGTHCCPGRAAISARRLEPA